VMDTATARGGHIRGPLRVSEALTKQAGSVQWMKLRRSALKPAV
jgi:hypothetical protein